MPHQSKAAKLTNLRRRLISSDRWLDAQLEVVTHRGEFLYRAGGCWDTFERKFCDRKATPKVVKLKESQEDIGRSFARYLEQRLAEDDSRSLIIFGGGKRGGGKTFIQGGLFSVSLALALPGSPQISVNITTKQKREVIEAIGDCSAPGWIESDVSDFRDPRTIFCTGSEIYWMSSKNPGALRQAGLPFEYVFINEGQDQGIKIYSNAVYAVRKVGGLVGIASNPPQETQGDWTATAHESIEAGLISGEYFALDPNANDAINQVAIPKIANALRYVDVDAYRADSLGIFKLSGDLAYPGFKSLPLAKGGHILGRVPDIGWVDVTRELTARAVNGEVGFDYIAGADFQRTPGSCASVAKIYRTPQGELVLCVREYVTTAGVEEDLSEALVGRGYYPGRTDEHGNKASSLLLVGDATGSFQNAEHRKRDPYSYARLRSDGWSIVPPAYHWKTRNPCNPAVRDSRAQMHALFDAHRVLFSEQCRQEQDGFPSLIDSFRQAKVQPSGSFVRKGHFTHGPDGVRYICWKVMPRPRPAASPVGIDEETFNELGNLRLFTSG